MRLSNFETDYIVVALGIDSDFVMPASVLLASIFRHLEKSCELRIYIAHFGVSDVLKERLNQVLLRCDHPFQIEYKIVDQTLLNEMRVDGHLSLATYFRLFLPTLLPFNIHRVIYLDSDLIVRSNLSKLWETDMEGMPVAAVREHSAPFVSSHLGVQRYRVLGLNPESAYLNAGVLLIDLEQWRSNNIAENVFRYLVQNADYVKFHDQEGINAVLDGNWKELDPRWNVPGTLCVRRVFESYEESFYKENFRKVRYAVQKQAKIIHFLGSRKPWVKGCGLPGQPLWLYTLSTCGWYKRSELLQFLNILFLYLDCVLRRFLRYVRQAIYVNKSKKL